VLLQHFPLPHYLHNVAWIRPDSTSSFVQTNLSFVNLLEIHRKFAARDDVSF
jgi:hypothetical protein